MHRRYLLILAAAGLACTLATGLFAQDGSADTTDPAVAEAAGSSADSGVDGTGTTAAGETTSDPAGTAAVDADGTAAVDESGAVDPGGTATGETSGDTGVVGGDGTTDAGTGGAVDAGGVTGADDPNVGDLGGADLGGTDLAGADTGGADLGAAAPDGTDASSGQDALPGDPGLSADGEVFTEDPGFIGGDTTTEAVYFDPGQTTFDEWATSDEAVDWDGDGSFSQEDYDLLVWLTGEATAQDVDGDGFLDEEDYALSQWLGGSADGDRNGDGVVDEEDFVLFRQDTEGIFVNEIYYVFAEPTHNGATVYWYSSEPGGSDTLRYREDGTGNWQVASVQSSGYEHQITVTGLKADTEYDFGARSLSPDGFVSDWIQDVFRTRQGADLRPAVGSDLDVQVTGESATLSWFTNRPTDAGFTISRAGQVVVRDTTDQEGQQSHDIYVEGLEPGVEYQFTLSSTPVDEEELVAQGLAQKGELVDIKEGSFTTAAAAQELQFTGPPISVVSATTAVIEVSLNQPAALVVDYGRADNILEKTTSGAQVKLYKDQVRVDQRLTQHSLTLSGLKAKTTYRYRLMAISPQGDTLSTDPYGDQQWNHDWQFTTAPAGDTLVPVIVEGPRVLSRDKIAVVEWTTDVETTGKVFIGTQGGTYGTPDEFVFVDRAPGGAPAFAQRHVVTLSALDSATTYAYRLESTGANGKAVVFTPNTGAGKSARGLQPPGGSGTFTTNNQADTQFPVILAGPTVTSRGRDRAVVEWTTDEPANSVVRYGRDRLEGSVSAGDNEVEHKLVLSNLQAGVSYKFVVNATDAAGNGATQSAEAFFTTTPELDLAAPRILSGPEVVYKNDRSAAIRWTTDEAATAQVGFGTTAQLGSQRNQSRAATVQEVSLTNLSPATTYFYRVSATDLANNGPTLSQVLSFSTEALPDLSAPALSAVEAVPSDSLAIVRWATDELGDSFVEYGTSDAALDEKAGDDKDLKNHEVVLTHLRPGTRYFFRVGSVDRAGNTAVRTQVDSFTTLTTADRTPPAAPTGLAGVAGNGQVSLSWSASSAADLGGYTLYRRTGTASFAPVASRLQGTSFIDLGLSNGQTYEYRLSAIDRALAPNESLPSSTLSVVPSAANAPTAPTQLGQEGNLFSPTLKFTNATPHTQGAALSYIIQVSSDSAFATVVASVSGLAEGSGGLGAGRTAWTVDRRLLEGQTFYWRARAVEGLVNGPFSETRQFKTQRTPAVVLGGDFNGDKTVNFDDFFLFADNFGKSATGEAAAFDLSKNGSVDFDDFFLFADNFGKSVTAKRWASPVGEETRARLQLELRAGEGEELVLQVQGRQMAGLQAFGLVFNYDPRLLRLEEARPGAASGPAGLFGVLHQEPGELVLGGGVAGAAGPLAQVSFQRLGPADQVALTVQTALVSRPGAQVSQVRGLDPVRARPSSWFLGANYPNPFNPATAIRYGLAEPGPVRLRIFDLLGQPVRTLVQASQEAGFYQLLWDGTDAQGRLVGNGLYFYLLETPQFTQARKMVLIK